MRNRLASIIVAAAMPAIVFAEVAAAASGEDLTAAGNQAYADGEFGRAVSVFREGLIDSPRSSLLRYNLGAALYRQGEFEDAARHFAAVASDAENEEWTARSAYNLGNTLYRIGKPLEEIAPQEALQHYGNALAAYRQAMAADDTDTDPKYGYEFVLKELEKLQEQMQQDEQQEQEQEQQQREQGEESPEDGQQQGDPQDGEQEGGEQQADSSQGDQSGEQSEDGQGGEQESAEQEKPDQQEQSESEQAGGGESEGEEADEQEAEAQSAGAGEQPPERPEQEQAQPSAGGSESADDAEAGGTAAGGVTAEPSQEEIDRRAAYAILDAARSEELDPRDVERSIGVAGIGDPAKDW